MVSIFAAIAYTVGKRAYGYYGLGDLFVFLFFGLLSVLGTYFLFVQHISLDLLLPAETVGLLSMAVLNLNNMRDINNDAAAGKKTLVVKLGSKRAKWYHYALLLTAMSCAVVYTILHYREPLQFLFLLSFIPLILNLRTVYKNEVPAALDGELKKVALSTFTFAILFGLFL